MSTFKLAKLRILWKKKMPKFETKNALFEYFEPSILKNFCYIWNWYPRICQVAKFRGKLKMLKFGTKNTLFGNFWSEIWKQYCHIWNQCPPICQIAKFLEKMKMGWNLISILRHISNQHLLICLIWKFLEMMKMFKFLESKCLNLVLKLPSFIIFGLEFLKLLSYLKSANLSKVKF